MSDAHPDTLPIACGRCGREVQTRPTAKGLARLPRGWRRHQETVWCDACWRGAFVLRAITLPVAGPVEGEWKELQSALDACWRNATTVANWAVQELLRNDIVRTPDLTKLPPMPAVYLYPGARAVAPEMDTQSVTSVLRAVESRYRALRMAVIWQRRAAPPTYRYPAPYPVPAVGWSVRETDGGALVLSVRLDGERREIRLRTGPRFVRQREAVRSLIAGESLAGEMSLYRRGSDVLAKLVLWMPRERDRIPKGGGTLYVRTGGDALWTYHVDQGEPRHLFADHVRRWIASYERRMGRLAEDTKAEKRPTKRRGRGIAETRDAWGRKQRARLDSHTHEASAMLAGYAARQRVSTVVYDDTDHGYLPRYPWAALRIKLAYKLEGAGIRLELAAGEPIPDTTGEGGE